MVVYQKRSAPRAYATVDEKSAALQTRNRCSYSASPIGVAKIILITTTVSNVFGALAMYTRYYSFLF